MAETKEKLEAFNWDEQAKEVDFFGENAPEGMVIDSEEDLSEKEVEKKSEEKKEKSLPTPANPFKTPTNIKLFDKKMSV